jgi:hypothetical protein
MHRVLDDALERLRHPGPEAADGGPNHGPMAAEARRALGDDAAVPPWVDAYRYQRSPMPETLLPMTQQTWRDVRSGRRGPHSLKTHQEQESKAKVLWYGAIGQHGPKKGCKTVLPGPIGLLINDAAPSGPGCQDCPPSP